MDEAIEIICFSRLLNMLPDVQRPSGDPGVDRARSSWCEFGGAAAHRPPGACARDWTHQVGVGPQGEAGSEWPRYSETALIDSPPSSSTEVW